MVRNSRNPFAMMGWSNSAGESTVKVERSGASNTFTARSEPHNRAAIHARADKN